MDELEKAMLKAIKYQMVFNQQNKEEQLIDCAKNCASIARQYSNKIHVNKFGLDAITVDGSHLSGNVNNDGSRD